MGGGQHNWGGGQRLAGEILEHVVLPHQSQNPKQLAGQFFLQSDGTFEKIRQQ
jgi:hypothetical protein